MSDQQVKSLAQRIRENHVGPHLFTPDVARTALSWMADEYEPEVFILDGELARDDGHHDLLPLPLGFGSYEAAEAYVEASRPLWGEYEIQRVHMNRRES